MHNPAYRHIGRDQVEHPGAHLTQRVLPNHWETHQDAAQRYQAIRVQGISCSL